VPIVLVGGDKSFGPLLPQVAKGLEKAGARSVTVESVAGGGHYLVDEKPAEIADLIERHASVDRRSP
jgi:pimeloyl-ACP methyl ester carboxylesterase